VAEVGREEGERRLTEHLRTWLGAWPDGGPEGLVVVGHRARAEPGWDGAVRPVAGVATPRGAVVSVPPEGLDAVRALGTDQRELAAGVGAALDLPGWRFASGAFRWSHAPAGGEAIGTWVARHDDRVPAWLRPFNGDVLVALVDDVVAAGVGRKQHDRHGHELAVVTEEAHRGKGLAARLVAQAARRVLDDGAVPTYLHAPGNAASAATAERAGFPDEGWQVLGLFPGEPG
jgi:GNAT superfamily N-acetyltransferase